MKYDAVIGITIAILAFSIYQGYNVLPLVGFIGLGVIFYFAFQRKGMLKNTSLGSAQGTSSVPVVSFSDIGGLESTKRELAEAVEFLKEEHEIRRLGIRPLKGILLCGPPGTGKTLLAKAVANNCQAAFLAVSGSEFIEMYAGVGAQRVRSLFSKLRQLAKAENKKNAILFIDELEVLGGVRGKGSNHMEYDQTLNQLLVELDGLRVDESVRILVIGATNRKDMLDPALLRPGRFDRIVQVDLPSKAGRLEILKIHVDNKPLCPQVNLEEIAAASFGFSGAHLESLCNEAAIMTLREKDELITALHFEKAIDKILLGEELNKDVNEKERNRVAVHESGHALVCELQIPGNVASVKISGRGAALGYMRQTQSEEKLLNTSQDLYAQLNIALGGWAAEQVVYGDHSTGASNDIKKACEIAELIIASGMSCHGVVDMSKVDNGWLAAENARLINGQLEKTVMMVESYQEALHIITNNLIVEETITGQQIQAILSQCHKAG